ARRQARGARQRDIACAGRVDRNLVSGCHDERRTDVETGSNGYEGARIAHLWEYPNLCVAIFGVQFHTPEGQQLYGASRIGEEMDPALEAAKDEGFLHQDRFLADGGA